MQIYQDKVFENPVEIIEVFESKKIKNAFEKIEQLKNRGLYLLGYMRYDLNVKQSPAPLIYFEAYDSFTPFVAAEPDYKIGTIIEPLISKEEYISKIDFIKNKIQNGITYEVNFTYPSKVSTNASEIDFYNHLLKNQKTPYNAFLKNRFETILSFSPELFFKLKGNKIFTKPMKGTVRRGTNKAEDEKLKDFLYNDKKNRAENIMIVDLLRNDLGRISKTGSVKVEKLFEIEEHKTLFQMTSEISAELENGTSLYDIIKAIFPCGSITGAPKLSTMKVISNTERFSREVYCGAIGYLHGDEAVFSVPIRILQKKKDESFYKYFAGGAIVWDSDAEDEWQETLTKTKFLEADFSLIETWVTDFDMHLARLKKSAQELGFFWNAEIEKIVSDGTVVNRIELFKDGLFEHTTRPIPEPKENPKIIILHKVNSENPFLYHKTSIRKPFPKDVFDEICVNQNGEITEGTFTNIAVLQNGELFTPPVSCGLLNGITRQKLLSEGKIKERILYEKDLRTAEKIYCFNSVRGVVEVTLC